MKYNLPEFILSSLRLIKLNKCKRFNKTLLHPLKHIPKKRNKCKVPNKPEKKEFQNVVEEEKVQKINILLLNLR